MSFTIPASEHLKELEMEAVATRKCLERIPENKFDFKPHPTSMNLGYLSLLVAEIPLWLAVMIEDGEIDFATFKHATIKTTNELVNHFDENMAKAKKVLNAVTDEQMKKEFKLIANGQVIFKIPVYEYIAPTINHWVHHRGQLTTFMRICEIPVPSIYGPSADDRNFVGEVKNDK